VAEPAARAELCHQVPARLIDIIPMIVRQFCLAPRLKLPRKGAMTLLEKWPVQEGAVTH
jgi:hypothetical protein